ncbi:DUF4433 domain-containing protein [Gammaproteobacteria bacterium]|nr:DUF4433 domain-containing protein [Gammaproteobacteria bacterium]
MNEHAKKKNIIDSRNISELIHFTPRRNIELIKTHGLISAKQAHIKKLPITRNDFKRLDNKKEGICLSITYANEYVLGKFKKKYGGKWSIIVVDPMVILTKKCFFYDCNAASSKFHNCSDEYLSSSEAFEGMFARSIQTSNGPRARAWGSRKNLTTDVQAEIIVTESIATNYLEFINFGD